MVSGGQRIGRTDHRQGRAEQPDEGASMRASETDLEVWEIGLTPIFAVRERPPHDGPPSVPRSRPRYTQLHRRITPATRIG